MRQSVGWGVLLLLLGGLATGCRKAAETGGAAAEVSAHAKLWTEVAAVLSKVTDKESMKEARPKLLELAEQLKKQNQATQQQAAAAATVPRQKRPTLSGAQTKLTADAREKYAIEVARVMKLDGGPALIEEFNTALIMIQKE